MRSIAATVLLFLLIFAGGASPAAAAVYFVATTGNDANDGLSGGTAFLTLGKAVAVSVTNDTINLGAGTFTETVTIDTPGLSIVGAGYASTIIDGADSLSGSGVIVCDTDGFLLRNVTLRRSLVGLNSTQGNNFIVQNCRITDCGDYGIALGQNANACLGDNRLDLIGLHALCLTGGGSHLITGNQIEGNPVLGDIGIYLSGANACLIRGNVIRNNSIGVQMFSSSNSNVFAQNSVYGNDTGVYYDPPIGDANNFSRNNIYGNTNYNVVAPGAYQGVLPKCYWGTSDSVAITSAFSFVTGMTWEPFLFTWIDTDLAADTTAPAAPAIVSVLPGDGKLTFTWTTPTVDEYGDGLSDLAGYRVYRWVAGDTPSNRLPAFATINDPTDTDFADFLAPGVRYRYQFTSLDNHSPSPNESWFSAVFDTGTSNAPAADAGNDTVGSSAQLFTLDASGSSDPNGDSLFFSWSQVSGAGVVITDPDSPLASATLNAIDTYLFQVTVTDSWGVWDTATFSIVVYDSAAPACTTTALIINLDATYVISRNVTLDLASDSLAAYALIGEDPAFTGKAWQPFSTSVPYTLADSDGTVTLYARFASLGWTLSAIDTDQIVLDRLGPLGPVLTVLDGTTVASPLLTLQLGLGEETAAIVYQVGQQAAGGDTWLPWPSGDTLLFSLSPGSDTRTVFARFRDPAGNVSADSVQVFLTGAPFPVREFRGQGLDARYVRLTWHPSPSADRDTVTLYWDNQTGTIDYNWPIWTCTSDSTGFETGPFALLDVGDSYAFGIRVASVAGAQESNTNVVTIAEVRLDTNAFLISPAIPNLSGKAISGSRFLLSAELGAGDTSGYSVTFEYRAAGATLFSDITAATPTEPNPDSGYPFYLFWDTTQLPDGDYDLRLKINAGVQRSDIIRVTIANNQNPEMTSRFTSTSFLELSQRVYADDTNTILAGDSGSLYQLTLPGTALGENTAIRLTVGDTASALNALDRLAYDTAGTVLDLELDNDQTQLGDTVTVSIPYADANGDSVIDGSRIRLSLVRVLYYDGAAWTTIAPENTWLDAALRLIWFRVNHFSKFAPGKEADNGDLGADDGTDEVPDGDIDLADAAAFTATYGSQSGDVNYDLNADIDVSGNSAGRIDFGDLAQFSTNYGTQ